MGARAATGAFNKLIPLLLSAQSIDNDPFYGNRCTTETKVSILIVRRLISQGRRSHHPRA